MINWKIRVKNVYFWLAIGGVILTAMGATPDMFTDWSIVAEKIKELFANPFMLGTAIIAIVGVVNDPTTDGMTDSMQVMKYIAPKKD